MTTAKNRTVNGIWLTGPIGESLFGESAINVRTVMDTLAKAPEGPLDVYINSPGGVVDEALTVRQMLRDCGHPLTITVTGLAASAATLITSIPGARVIMSRGSLMMIHNPAGAAYGDQHKMRKAADVTEKIAAEMREIYATRSGLEPERVEQMMNEETWLTADDAVELGFADEVDESSAVTASVSEKYLAIGGAVFSRELLPRLPSSGLFNLTTENHMQKEKTVPEAKPEAKKAEITTAEQLMAAFPELCASLKANAAEEERRRLQELDELTGTGNDELVMKAKYETVMDARECALMLVKDMKGRLAAQRQARAADAAELNALKDIETSGSGSSDEEMRSRMMDGVLSYMKK